MSNDKTNIFDTLNNTGSKSYNPASFEEKQPEQQPAYSGTAPTTMRQLMSRAMGSSSSALSTTLMYIAPVLELFNRKNPDLKIFSLSATDAPDLFADYIVVAGQVKGIWNVIPMLLTETIRIPQGEYPVPTFAGTQAKLKRLPAELLDVKSVVAAIVNGSASALKAAPDSVKFILNEYYIREDFTRLSVENVEKTLDVFIKAAEASLYTLRESDLGIYSPGTVRQMGYPTELRVYESSVRNPIHDIYGDVIPADSYVEVKIMKQAAQNTGMVNVKDEVYAQGTDVFLMGNAAVTLDLVYAKPKVVDGVVGSQFLQPNIIITQTNIGNDGLSIQGLGSKIMGIVGAMIYATPNESKWFNLAKRQMEAYQQSVQSKNHKRGLSRNWQMIGTQLGEKIPFSFTASGANEEAAEILLDSRYGYIYSEAIYSIDLMRGSNSGAADSIFADAYLGNMGARQMILDVLDGITANRFSALFGNGKIFVENLQQVVPAGVGDFGGETHALRECSFISTLTQTVEANDGEFIKFWAMYQDSTDNNMTTAYATVYDRIYGGMCTNVVNYGNYVRHQLSGEFINSLLLAFSSADNANGYATVDMSNLKGYGQAQSNQYGSRTYGSNSVTANTFRSNNGNTASSAYGGRSRFNM